MIRFTFHPRHPITKVAFTADGREVVTAQPFAGIAVRDRLTGAARWTYKLPRASSIQRLEVHASFGDISVCWYGGRTLLDPITGRDEPTAAPGYRTVFASFTLDRLSMWWGDSTRGELVSLEVTENERPVVNRGNRSARLNSAFRWRHLFPDLGTLTYSADGRQLALGNGESLRVFDLAPLDTTPIPSRARTVFQPILTLDRPDPMQHGTHADKTAEHWLPPVAFDHAGRTMFTLGLRNRVRRIDLATGGVIGEWGWRCQPIRSLAVAPDDLTAAAGCQRGELVLWDLE
ncbi:MAG: hypothetical protein MUF18_05845 [Fimbriiglobus sp.]|jgi:WD40 repeat protein|nr:hypothetical protein [Fimbriiglobus sp.]